MDCITIYPKGTQEREQLEKAAALLTKHSPCGYTYYVDEVYFDIGQDWVWTSILCDAGYQAISPAEQEAIILADDLDPIIEEIFADKFCPDRL